jgi:hypothetical protein
MTDATKLSQSRDREQSKRNGIEKKTESQATCQKRSIVLEEFAEC